MYQLVMPKALEAEDAEHETFEVSNSVDGYTGEGYVYMSRDRGRKSITWEFHAPRAGRYILEFRYINSWGRESDLDLTVNGLDAGFVKLWNTGTSDSWAWDRALVDLKQGKNSLRIQAGGRIMMDHVNVLYAGRN